MNNFNGLVGSEGINVNIGFSDRDLLMVAAIIIVASVISGVLVNVINKAF